AGHSERVATAAERTARALRLGDAMAEEVRLAALFHDIGKIGVADATLRKPSRLSPEEVDEMRRHPDAGARILGNVPSFERALVWVRHHHEFFDGSGYPDGLRGSSIPLASRIILVADAFDAMTTDRPYRSGMGVEAASRELRRHAGRQFDPQIVDVFLDLVGARA
ncbi:MAG: HD-GYP domain-containing protein, partial [Candidatus Methylomirabilis sp.]|nr:HD-GYP domain-containing protein [Deltaproteobacteria bacterium]